MRYSILLLVGFVALAAGAAHAQDYYYGGGYNSYHSSTYEEGVQRGFADVVRSAGQANLLNSEAAKNYEDARSANLDNHLKYANTYFAMRRANDAFRQEQRGPRPSTEQLFRYANERAPDRLASSDLDPVTGDIQWPSILLEPRYEKSVTLLDAMMEYWADHGRSLSGSQYRTLRVTTDELENQLKANIQDYPANDYIAAKKFIEGLKLAAGGA